MTRLAWNTAGLLLVLCVGCEAGSVDDASDEGPPEPPPNLTAEIEFTPGSSEPFQGAQALVVELGDLDGDGDLDAILGTDEGASVWFNDGTGHFESEQELLSMPEGAWVSQIGVGDLDGDGDLDAVLDNTNHPVWFNDGTGHLAEPALVSPWPIDVKLLTLGDLDGDGDLDIAKTLYGTGTDRGVQVAFNDGSGAFDDGEQHFGPGYSSATGFGDLDGDGDLDVFLTTIAAGDSDGSNMIWLNDGDGTFTDSGQRLGSLNGFAVSLADLDGDGDLDAFVGGFEGAYVWAHEGSGEFSENVQALMGHDHRVVSLGDVDGDGDLDALLPSYGPGASLWRNDGAGEFSLDPTGFPAGYWLYSQFADLDGDGDLDAILAAAGDPVEVFFNETPQG